MATSVYKKTVLAMLVALCCSGALSAQRYGRFRPYAHAYPRPYPHRTVVVNNFYGGYGGGYYHYRPYWRPAYYHPYWYPGYTFHRRWVYFPRYNFYWDNWHNTYVFWNGVAWISATTPPPVVVNVNLSKEKNYELSKSDDEVDDVYRSNSDHQTEYKK